MFFSILKTCARNCRYIYMLTYRSTLAYDDHLPNSSSSLLSLATIGCFVSHRVFYFSPFPIQYNTIPFIWTKFSLWPLSTVHCRLQNRLHLKRVRQWEINKQNNKTVSVCVVIPIKLIESFTKNTFDWSASCPNSKGVRNSNVTFDFLKRHYARRLRIHSIQHDILSMQFHSPKLNFAQYFWMCFFYRPNVVCESILFVDREQNQLIKNDIRRCGCVSVSKIQT